MRKRTMGAALLVVAAAACGASDGELAYGGLGVGIGSVVGFFVGQATAGGDECDAGPPASSAPDAGVRWWAGERQ